MLSIPSPNTDRSLLTRAQLRAAVGVEDGSKDAALIDLGNYVAVLIAQACRVATAAGIPPTLRLETVVETIVLGTRSEWLDLARRPVTTIGSVIENGTEIDLTGYRLAGSAGRLQRRSGSFAALWQRDRDIVVTYSAGWATVPDDLARAAIKFVQAEWNSRLARSAVEAGTRGRGFRARILGRSHQGLGRPRRRDGHPRARRLRHAGFPMRGLQG